MTVPLVLGLGWLLGASNYARDEGTWEETGEPGSKLICETGDDDGVAMLDCGVGNMSDLFGGHEIAVHYA